MQKETITLGHANSIDAIDREQKISVEVAQTHSNVPNTDIKASVDAYEVYNAERGDCEDYRLILTVRPYCSNILHNACTEVVWKEGSDKANVLTDNDKGKRIEGANFDGVNSGAVMGRVKVERSHAVQNTEYSKENIGFEYHSGEDIFNNHLLRSESFRIVNRYKSNPPEDSDDRKVFNTIKDIMRDPDGTPIKTCTRNANTTTLVNKHIYDHSNILGFSNGAVFNAKLGERNGWYGFVNGSSIGTTTNSLDISHIINNRDGCEFIDLYPDRSLYSFTPKENLYRDRLEYNWQQAITYPKYKFYGHNLVTNRKANLGATNEMDGDGLTNGLLVYKASVMQTANGRRYLYLRTFTQHGVGVGNYVHIYHSSDGGYSYTECDNTYPVHALGDCNGNFGDYYFSISNNDLFGDIFKGRILDLFYFQWVNGKKLPDYPIEELSAAPTDVPTDDDNESRIISFYQYFPYMSVPPVVWDETNTMDGIPAQTDSTYPHYIRVKKEDSDGYDYYELRRKVYVRKSNIQKILSESLTSMEIRIANEVNGVKSEYYIRKFAKIPNRKYAREPYTTEMSYDTVKYLRYVNNNAKDEDGVMYAFDSEIQNMAFAKTIYGDDVTQNVFTDKINVRDLRDNLGRPLSEIYVTTIKNNKGNKEWYNLNQYGSENVEFSHCFGKVTSGFEFHIDEDDDSSAERDLRGLLSDVHAINNSYGVVSDVPKSRGLEEWEGNTETKIEDDTFYGDLVEFNAYSEREVILSEVCYRFNTAQRELCDVMRDDNGNYNGQNKYQFIYDELTLDDYDRDGFKVTTYAIDDGKSEITPENDNVCSDKVVLRPEGYYYKGHDRIQIRQLSEQLYQGCHYPVALDHATAVYADGKFVEVKTRLKHLLVEGDTIYLSNNDTDIWYTTEVTHVTDGYTFVINAINEDIEIAEGKPYIDYEDLANLINNGTIVVRRRNPEIPNYAKKVGMGTFFWRVPERVESEFPFANGCLYIEHNMPLYLKRQDPEGINGLYFYGLPGVFEIGDLPGKVRKEDNYSVEVEDNPIC